MSVAVATGRRAPRRSAGALVLHQLRYDALSFLRNRQSRFFTIALPVLFLVIFCAVFGNGKVPVAGGSIKESTYYVPGLVALGLIQAAFATLVVSVTAQRESGVLKRRRATPEPAWVVITGRALTAVGTGVVIALVLVAIGYLGYGAKLPGRTIPAIVLTIAVGAIAFCALGYALVSAINSADSAQPVVQAILLPLYFISGIFVPAHLIPQVAGRYRQRVPGPPPPAGDARGVQPAHGGRRFCLGRSADHRRVGGGRARHRAAPLPVAAEGQMRQGNKHEGDTMATTFSYELSTSGSPDQAKARLQAVLSKRLLRPAVGRAGSNLECALQLSKQTATSLTYTPKLRVPLPISTTIWLSRKLGGERVKVTFTADADTGGTRVAVSGKVGHGAEPVASREFWDGVLSAGG
jgi:ABC-2 type transport system permease protein